MIINNETIGICCEIAISDYFGIKVDENYRKRGNEEIEKSLISIIKHTFNINSIPKPVKLISAKQNKIDIKLENNQTLSVKSNKKELGKVAPQVIGQPSSRTFFEKISQYNIGITNSIFCNNNFKNLEYRKTLFKNLVFFSPEKLIKIYWEHLFEADYLICFFNILDKNNNITGNPESICLTKESLPPLDKNDFSFTRTIENWNESNTIKYKKISIGEFQIHNNRDNFKFRFNFNGLLKAGLIAKR